jgi:hypothetical protein
MGEMHWMCSARSPPSLDLELTVTISGWIKLLSMKGGSLKC